MESAVTVIPPKGPSPSNWIVRTSFSPFIIAPIIRPADSVLPRAAVATGLRPWAFRAYSAVSFDVTAKARIKPSAAVARTR